MISLFRKLGWLLRRRKREDDLEAELRFHLEETAEEQRLEGVSPQDAVRAARRDLGSVAFVQEQTRAAWSWNWFEQFRQDFRYALRTMIRNPVFTMMAALSLALGIGANTAIYSFLDALLLRALPVVEPQRLAVLNWHNQWERDTVFHGGSGSVYDDAQYGHTARIFAYPAFEAFQKSQTVFSALFAYLPTRNLNLIIHGQAEIDAGQFVSGDYFRGLGLPPAAGRLLTSEDDRAGAPPAIVLSSGFSQTRFGSAAAAVGQTILVNNLPFTVVGVAPPDFYGVDPAISAKFYLPVHANSLVDPTRFGGARRRRYLGGNDYWIEMMGRLRPGVSMAQAQGELAAVFHAWVETTASTDAERRHLPELHLTNGGAGIDTLRRRYSQPFFLLWAMVGLILAIACANIANLLLARTTSRRREMAVRLGMGAGRGRVIRQLLTESVVLALVGGILGVLFAFGGVRFLTALLSGGGNVALDAELNWRVFAIAGVLAIATGLLFGLAPAVQATRVDVMPALKGNRAAERRSRLRFARFTMSHALVVAQIALSLLLLAGAGLFVRTLSNLRSVDLGFNREHILLFKLNARQAGHRDPEITVFYRDLQQRFAAIPGVRSATVSNSPLVGEGTWGSPVVPLGKQTADDRPPDGHGTFVGALSTHVLTVGPAFFDTMRIPLLAGREIDERDRPGSLPVAIVNETWAKLNLPGQNPLGQHILLQTDVISQEMEIIGVARNSRYGYLKGAFPAVVYMSFWQNLYRPPEEATYALRAAGDPLALASSVREIVSRADSRLPVIALTTQSAMVDQTMSGEIMFARLCTGFAMLALAIACVGLYGTIAYTVARRTSEIGIRLALGAGRTHVLWLVMRQVAAMASVGLVLGALAVSGLSRLVESMLFGVKPNDPATIGFAVATLLAAVAVAAYVPARRASRIQPVAALRHD